MARSIRTIPFPLFRESITDNGPDIRRDPTEGKLADFYEGDQSRASRRRRAEGDGRPAEIRWTIVRERDPDETLSVSGAISGQRSIPLIFRVSGFRRARGPPRFASIRSPRPPRKDPTVCFGDARIIPRPLSPWGN